MRFDTVQSVIAVGLAVQLSLGTALASSPVIGTVIAKGSFRLDQATVRGNATLTEGSLIETAQASSTLDLKSGARLELAALSKGKVFGDHLRLEKGEGTLENGTGFHLEANGLSVYPATGTSRGRVALSGANRVTVSAASGSFRVLNSRGVLVANIATGKALEFEPTASVTNARVTGRLESKSGRLLLTDETTRVTVEVTGNGISKEVGNRVELTGSIDPSATPGSDASQVIRASRVYRLLAQAGGAAAPAGTGGTSTAGTAGAASGTSSAAGGAAGGAAAGGAAGGAAAAGAAAGVATGIGIGVVTTVAIVGGVAVAATLGGLAAAGKLPGQVDASLSR